MIGNAMYRGWEKTPPRVSVFFNVGRKQQWRWSNQAVAPGVADGRLTGDEETVPSLNVTKVVIDVGALAVTGIVELRTSNRGDMQAISRHIM